MLIVKDQKSLRSQHPLGKLRYAVCVDGSDKSLRALMFTNNLVDRSKGDQLIIICVETDSVKPAIILEQVRGLVSNLFFIMVS